MSVDIFNPVPLDEVLSSQPVIVNGKIQERPFGWVDLGPQERIMVRTIDEGQYWRAALLTGNGQKPGYDLFKVEAFLESARRQHNPYITLGNQYVRLALGYSY
jgi:hypothetical protein